MQGIVGCGSLARRCEIRADLFHFRIEMFPCSRHQSLVAKNYRVQVTVLDQRKRSKEVA
jgi:hypothetical protein